MISYLDQQHGGDERGEAGRAHSFTLSLCPSVYKYTNTNGKMQLHKYKQDPITARIPTAVSATHGRVMQFSYFYIISPVQLN